MSSGPAYRRILLKLSGEALLGDSSLGIDPSALNALGDELAEIARSDIQLAIVMGGGNYLRWEGSNLGIERVTTDHMAMLGTVINALAIKDALNKRDIENVVLSALPIGHIVEAYHRDRAIHLLEEGKTLIFAGGTGNPLFTTDTASSLRAVEIGADIILKASHVDGVYSSDPKKNPSAKRYDYLSFDEALEKQLGVMDLTAFDHCREHHLPIRVFNIKKAGNLIKVAQGGAEGTLIS